MTTANLETAREASGLRRVAIDPVSRVEGHSKVTLLLDEDNRRRTDAPGVGAHFIEIRRELFQISYNFV